MRCWLPSVLSSSICIQRYEFPPEYYFCCISQHMISSTSFSFSAKFVFVVVFYLRLSLWSVYCLISKYLGDFPGNSLLMISNLATLWHTLHDSLFKNKVCFMSQNMVHISGCSMRAWEKCVTCCCWTEYFPLLVDYLGFLGTLYLILNTHFRAKN